MIENCVGYKSLLAAVEQDECESPGSHDYRGKLKWALDRAQHYADKTGLDASEILNMWEKKRDYWYMNFYQECNQPEIKDDNVRVFDSAESYRNSVGNSGFRCPMCNGLSHDPYTCDSGLEMSKGKTCDWKSYGLLGTLGRGVTVFLKSEMAMSHIFKPIAWED